eukprot:g7280.t1
MAGMQDVDLGTPTQAPPLGAGGSGGSDSTGGGDATLHKVLQRWDFFRKVPRDLTEQTDHGSTLSTCGSFFLVVLFLLEFNSFLTVTSSTSFALDHGMDERLEINFEVSMLRLPCRWVHVEVEDFVGTHKLNVTKDIEFTRIDANGRPVPEGQGYIRPRRIELTGASGSIGARRLLSVPEPEPEAERGPAAVAGAGAGAGAHHAADAA